jgi:hypothetical protein
MDQDTTSPTSATDTDPDSLDPDRTAAEQALEVARRNPILSAEQACAIAQVHALLAIERRLAQVFAALVSPKDPGGVPAPVLGSSF